VYCVTENSISWWCCISSRSYCVCHRLLNRR